MHRLWDGLADFDASQINRALEYLMQGLCDLVDAQNADWIAAVRLAGVPARDPAAGWRPLVIRFLNPTDKLYAAFNAQARCLDQQLINEVAARIVSAAGRFRASRLCDVVSPEWFASDFYQAHYRDCDREDAVYVAFPINKDAESNFGVFRAVGRPRFTADERDLIAYALRGIKWFHRQLFLSHGLSIASTPLSAIERQVLLELLAGLTEKQIAANLGKSYPTTHEYVTSIFRKFGVNHRPALTALWQGTGA
ncbi:MAG: helix-turn-helix transcriptional regulator [Sulfuritalea sp.]|nr:helix-turn-helix transcriptional regulator [Sulfuritalea sp.]